MSKDKQSNSSGFSHDSAFKSLVHDFPEHIVRVVLPDLEVFYGDIVSAEPLVQEMNKQKLTDKGRVLDISLRVRFREEECLIVLIEHKGDKDSFSIYTLAHYTLDLMEIYPDAQIIPTVVFADPAKWRKDVDRELKLESMGRTWFHFSYKKLKLKDVSADSVDNSENPVWHILTPLLNYPKDKRLKYLGRSYHRLFRLLKRSRFRKYLDFIDRYGKISGDERDAFVADLQGSGEREGPMIAEWLEQKGEIRGREEGRKEGRKEGQAEGKKEAQMNIAQGLFNDGFDLAFIIKYTGLTQEDLKHLS